MIFKEVVDRKGNITQLQFFTNSQNELSLALNYKVSLRLTSTIVYRDTPSTQVLHLCQI